jgi:hypothetical protein
MLHLRLAVIAVTLAVGGCHQADVKDYTPPEEASRQALATALDAWKAGKSPDQIGATSPAVNAQDKQWREGKQLTAYEIVGPEPGEDQNARFRVRLTVAGAAAPQETTYVVVGKDPIWVYSAESYQQMSGTTTGM